MNAKQEIHETLRRCVRYARPLSQSEEDRVRAILETHTLEPIDEREFDPTLCGFEVENEYHTDDVCQSSWGLNFEWRIIKTWSNTHDPVLVVQYECGGQDGPLWDTVFDGPGPATQSDGERLLKLLGVLK